MKKYSVKWKSEARISLKKIFEHIAPNSHSAAVKVRNSIVALVESLKYFPAKFSKEDFLQIKGAEIRSISIWSYKVVYEIVGDEIIIIDIFHTSRDPQKNKR